MVYPPYMIKNYTPLTKEQEVSSGGSRGVKDMHPPGFKFFQSHAVFEKIWQNHMLALPLGSLHPSSEKSWIRHWSAVADLHSKILDARPPLGVQILSISCIFWENLAKSYVGAPPGVGDPPRGNPRSATGQHCCLENQGNEIIYERLYC